MAFVGGFALALFLYYVTRLTWVLTGIFWLCAIALQIFYTHRLNSFLGGADPVAAFGARNLRQLKNTISVPFSISTLNFIVKVFAWAGLCALLFLFGWLKIETMGRFMCSFIFIWLAENRNNIIAQPGVSPGPLRLRRVGRRTFH
ncbi:MAG: hypothetical protein JRI67_09905 [Deltaproteobacteria bacterium]|nr:hypothetical protein [Deltaproteobacteria bacterium]